VYAVCNINMVSNLTKLSEQQIDVNGECSTEFYSTCSLSDILSCLCQMKITSLQLSHCV